jgi:hypothetical protein
MRNYDGWDTERFSELAECEDAAVVTQFGTMDKHCAVERVEVYATRKFERCNRIDNSKSGALPRARTVWVGSAREQLRLITVTTALAEPS